MLKKKKKPLRKKMNELELLRDTSDLNEYCLCKLKPKKETI